MLTLEAAIETPPTPAGDAPPREGREVRATGATYEATHADLVAQVPDGWRLIWIRRTSAE